MSEAVRPEMTLAAHIRAASLDYDMVLRVATQVGDELAAAHAAGRAHGHLTSNQVLMREGSGPVRVTLLGFAEDHSGSASQSNGAERTLADATAVAADVFAYGTLLEEMCAALESIGHPAPDWKEGIAACLDADPARRPGILEAMRRLGLPASEATVAAAPEPSATREPKSWGQFHLLQRLGQGGFGEVYRAWDPVIEREVALKLLLPRGLDPEQQLVEIVAEARAMARVRHPGIVPVYGVDRHDGRVGFWSDFVRGRTLQRLVETQGPMAAEGAAAMGIALCDALSAVHGAGLLHRDIKPSNCMRDENGRVLLMDFGLSRDLQQVGTLAGTPNYMAPELLAGSAPSVQSDVYAMGVLLLYLCTGAYPLTRPEAHSGALPAIPAPLQEVIDKATAREPGQRYASAQKMGDALAGAQAAMAQPAGAQKKRSGISRAAWIGVVAVMIVAGAIVVPMLRRYASAKAAGATPAAYQDYLSAEALLDRYDKPGNVEKAIALDQSVLERSPDFALAQAELARADWRMYINTSEQKWADAANQAAANAMKINPNLARVEMTAGNLHIAQGQMELGMQELQQAEQLEPVNADVHAALAEAYRQQERPDAAKKEFQTAMDLAPEEWRWPYLLGAMQLDNGDYAGAEASLKSALAKTPDNAMVLYNLGVAYRKDNHLDAAQAAYQQSLRLNPREDTMMALGAVDLLEGRVADAVGMYRQAVSAAPSDWHAWGNLGSAEYWAGDNPAEVTSAFQKAVQLGEQEMKLTPNDPFLLALLARYYAHLGQADDAVRLIRKSLALAPNDPDVLESDGEAWELTGDRVAAIALIAKGLRFGSSVDYVRKVPELKALRRDPRAPQEIRD